MQSLDKRETVIRILWTSGGMTVNVEGNMTLDQINLACDALKKQILNQLEKVRDVRVPQFTPRRIP